MWGLESAHPLLASACGGPPRTTSEPLLLGFAPHAHSQWGEDGCLACTRSADVWWYLTGKDSFHAGGLGEVSDRRNVNKAGHL